MESISTDSEFESLSSQESESSSSNEFSMEEALINTFLPTVSLATTVTQQQQQQSKDDLIKNKLAEKYPLIQKPLSTTKPSPTSLEVESSNLACHEAEKKKKKDKVMKQVFPPLVHSVTGEPYSYALEGKKPTSDLDKELAKSLREALDGKSSPTQKPMTMPDLLPISSLKLDCPPSAMKKDKKDKKGKKKDKRFTMSDIQLKPHFSDRLATEMMFQDGIQNSTIKSIMTTGCITQEKEGPCDGVTILAHIRQFHYEYYHLLYSQNLLDIVESRKDLALLIPPARLLVTLDVTSEATRSVLLYHIVVVPRGQAFQTVDGMLQYETLSGDYIQVESDNGVHYVNGLLAKPDVNCLFHIYHVPQILDKSNIVSIASPEPGDFPPEDNPPEFTDEEPAADEPMMGTETLFIATKMSAITSSLVESKTALGNLASKMNNQFYLASHEMKDFSVESQLGGSLHLNIYNTSTLFTDYSEGKMLDISRVKPETVLELRFAKEDITQLDMKDLRMTEYQCQPTKMATIKKSDLKRGLVGLSFQLKENPGFVVLMCKMDSLDGNCFVSEDKNVLMRFSQDRLECISLNQEALSAIPERISTTPLDDHHFLEYRLQSPDELYEQKIGKGEFDAMLLTQGKIKRWLKKKTQQVTDKTKCGYKRLQSIDLSPIPTGYLKKLVDQISIQTSSVVGQGSFVTLNAFDKSCRVVDSKSVLAKRFNVTTEKGDKIVVYEFNSSEATQSSLEGEYHLLEIQLDASPKLTIHTHSINRKANNYYTARRNSNVYLFAFDPQNGRLRSLYITVAKSHIGRKILEYRL